MKNEIKLLKTILQEIRLKIEKYKESVIPKNIDEMYSEIELKLSFMRIFLGKINKKIKKNKLNLYKRTQNCDNKSIDWQRNLFEVSMRKYQQALKKYQREVNYFNEMRKTRVKIMAKIINIKLTNKQLKQLIKDPHLARKIIKRKFVTEDFFENLVKLEKSRIILLNIEKEIIKMIDLIMDYKILLATQSRQIRKIRHNIMDCDRKIFISVKHLKKIRYKSFLFKILFKTIKNNSNSCLLMLFLLFCVVILNILM